MPVENVTVQYVNEPKPGRKTGSIKTQDGNYYNVWPDKLHLFQPGNSYRIIYTVNESGYRTFKSLAGADDPQAPIGRPPVAKPNGFTRPATSPQQSVDIFVTGTVQQWLNGAAQAGTPFPDANTIEWMVRAATDGWNKAHKPPVDELNPPPPLDDEIPY